MTRLRVSLIALMLAATASLAAAQARPAPDAPPAPPAPRPRPELQAPTAPAAKSAAPAPPTPPVAPAPPSTNRAAQPKHPGQLINVKIDFTITEQRADGTPAKRTVSLMVADGEGGSVRSEPEAWQMPGAPLQLNVDARPEVVGTNKIRLQFNLQYSGPAQGNLSSDTPRGTIIKNNLRQAISLVLEDGKSVMVAQSADPNSDRTVTLEVKATILK